MNKKLTVVLLLVLAAGCGSLRDGPDTPAMDPKRKVGEQDCSRPIDTDGNLLCREVGEAERRAKIEEEERQARAKKEAEVRARQLALEEAARKQRAAEEERLAAERRRLEAERLRLEAEAARRAQLERERQEKAEAQVRARQLAEQEAREAAARECRRLEQERLGGRALLENFVANYGKVEENKGIAGQITTFLDRARKVKPCPPG